MAIPVNNTIIVCFEQPFHSLRIIPQTFEKTTFNAIRIHQLKVSNEGESAKNPFPRHARRPLTFQDIIFFIIPRFLHLLSKKLPHLPTIPAGRQFSKYHPNISHHSSINPSNQGKAAHIAVFRHIKDDDDHCPCVRSLLIQKTESVAHMLLSLFIYLKKLFPRYLFFEMF